jgi:hypothetical protein
MAHGTQFAKKQNCARKANSILARMKLSAIRSMAQLLFVVVQTIIVENTAISENQYALATAPAERMRRVPVFRTALMIMTTNAHALRITAESIARFAAVFASQDVATTTGRAHPQV